jgi:2,3-dihydroxybenzoate-AMP ligase
MIPRTHNDYVYNVKQCGWVAGYNAYTVFLAVLPMGHNYTLGCPGYLAAFYAGGKVVISTAIDEDTVFSTIEREKVTDIAAAGPLLARWIASPAPAKYNTSSLKVIQNGGARCAPEIRTRVMELFDCFMQEVYGTGEGLLNLVPLDADEDMVINSSGKPISIADEIKILDDNDKEVPLGGIGELVIRGPYNIRGYYKAAEQNTTAFTADGYYRMGDLCTLNDRGFLFVQGRKKDMINRGGEKISCEEVENYVLAFPKVENVSMIAMPDKMFGEKACACVIPKKGETFDLKELVTFMKGQNIASFKLPERLELLDAFPISPAGKILKRDLVEMVTKKLAEEEAAAK